MFVVSNSVSNEPCKRDTLTKRSRFLAFPALLDDCGKNSDCGIITQWAVVQLTDAVENEPFPVGIEYFNAELILYLADFNRTGGTLVQQLHNDCVNFINS